MTYTFALSLQLFLRVWLVDYTLMCLLILQHSATSAAQAEMGTSVAQRKLGTSAAAKAAA